MTTLELHLPREEWRQEEEIAGEVIVGAGETPLPPIAIHVGVYIVGKFTQGAGTQKLPDDKQLCVEEVWEQESTRNRCVAALECKNPLAPGQRLSIPFTVTAPRGCGISDPQCGFVIRAAAGEEGVANPSTERTITLLPSAAIQALVDTWVGSGHLRRKSIARFAPSDDRLVFVFEPVGALAGGIGEVRIEARNLPRGKIEGVVSAQRSTQSFADRFKAFLGGGRNKPHAFTLNAGDVFLGDGRPNKPVLMETLAPVLDLPNGK